MFLDVMVTLVGKFTLFISKGQLFEQQTKPNMFKLQS